MRTDTELYLSLVRAGLGEKGAVELGEDNRLASADWSWITASARRHRLGNLLFEGLRQLDLVNAVPLSVWKSLESAYYTNLVHTFFLLEHAQSIIKKTKKARRGGAPMILLKGASFAGWLYPSPALRPMGDLDILVRAEDLDFFSGVAEELGYRDHQTADHARSLRHRQSGTYLELHTSLTSCPDYLRVDLESLFEQSIPSVHLPARTLSPEDHLLHLCLHGSFQHGFRQAAVNACDAYLLSRRPELRWDRFFERASERRLAPLVYGGLSLCHRLFPTDQIQKAVETLQLLVSLRQRTRAERLQTDALLSPACESVFGSPWDRLAWTPGILDGLALTRESLRARTAGQTNPNQWPSFRRGLALLWRHGPPEWLRQGFRKPADTPGPRPKDLTTVSIGEASNV